MSEVTIRSATIEDLGALTGLSQEHAIFENDIYPHVDLGWAGSEKAEEAFEQGISAEGLCLLAVSAQLVPVGYLLATRGVMKRNEEVGTTTV